MNGKEVFDWSEYVCASCMFILTDQQKFLIGNYSFFATSATFIFLGIILNAQ